MTVPCQRARARGGGQAKKADLSKHFSRPDQSPLRQRQSSASSLSVALAMDVVHDNACAFNRHSQPLLFLERALGILVAALPMLAHGGARKFIILSMPLI